MNLIIATVLLCIVSLNAYADGYTTIHGTNERGEEIRIDKDQEPDIVEPAGPYLLYTITVGGKEFEKQLCNYTGINSFSCSIEGGSPVAGATYLFKEDPKGCGNIGICVRGCTARTPHQMYQGSWECYKPECPSRAATDGVLSGDKVNLREQPDITSRVLRNLIHGTKVKVLERNDTCLSIGSKDGQWVKVRVLDKDPIKEGWIFDAYVAYPVTPQ